MLHNYIAQLFQDGKLPCRHCKRELPINKFIKHKKNKYGYRYECSDCYGPISRYKEVKGFIRNTDRPKNCEICGRETDLVIDHCHNRMIFRGRLCNGCNVGLGHFRDNPKNLAAALVYLKKTGTPLS